jgi:hypothetical protein
VPVQAEVELVALRATPASRRRAQIVVIGSALWLWVLVVLLPRVELGAGGAATQLQAAKKGKKGKNKGKKGKKDNRGGPKPAPNEAPAIKADYLIPRITTKP